MLLMTVLLPFYSLSQESTGQSLGNFAGIAAARINPSLINSQKVYTNFNLVSASVFFQNDFAFLPKNDVNLWNLIFGTDTLPSYSRSFVHYRYVTNTSTKNAALVLNSYGPSFMLATKKQSFGIHIAARSFSSATNIPYEIPIFSSELQGFAPLHHINFKDKSFQIAALVWSEIGLTYATNMYKKFNHQVDVGITLNRLFGADGGFMKVYRMDYVVIDGRTVDIFHMDMDAGFALPIDYNANVYDPLPIIKGKGLGLDIGVTYTHLKSDLYDERTRRNCEYNYLDYDWRIGVSLLDAGAIRFGKSAELHQGRNINVYWNKVDTIEVNNIHQLVHDVSSVFLKNPDASLVANSFTIALPAALSMQFDWHAKDNLFLNVVAIQPIGLYKYQVRRPALLSLTPRFESTFFEFAVPFGLYNYQLLRMGASVRMGFLTVGTERLGVLMGLNDVSGLDIYVSIKFGLLKGKCYQNPDTGACFNSDSKGKRMKIGFLKYIK